MPRTLRVALWIFAVVALIAGSLVINEVIRRNRKLYVLNGLTRPIKFKINGVESVVYPTEVKKLEIAEGSHNLELDLPNRKPETIEMSTSYFERFYRNPVWVLNLAHSAGVIEHDLYYAQNPQPSTQRFVDESEFSYFPHVDYAFVPYPEKISVKSGGHEEKKALSAKFETVAETSDRLLYSGVSPDVILGLAESHLVGIDKLNGEDTKLCERYSSLAVMNSERDRATAFLKPKLALRPVGIPWHRAYQFLRDTEENYDALVKEYAEGLQQSPDDAVLRYLYARLDSDSKSDGRLLEESRASSELYWPSTALAFRSARSGDWERAYELAKEAEKRDAPTEKMEDLKFDALMGLGRFEEIIAQVKSQPNEIGFGLPEFYVAAGRFEDALSAIDSAEKRLQRENPPGVSAAIMSEAVKAAHINVYYMMGDFERVGSELKANQGARLEGLRFYHALATGAPEEINEESGVTGNPWGQLQVATAFERKGDRENAKKWRALVIQSLRAGHINYRRAAQILETDAPTKEQLELVDVDNDDFILILADVLARFPEMKAEILPWLDRLCVRRKQHSVYLRKLIDSEKARR